MKKVSDSQIMRTVLDYRQVTIDQISELLFNSLQVARRRVRALEQRGFLGRQSMPLGKGRGRPESFLTAQPSGVQKLRAQLPDLPSDWTQSSLSSRLADHQISINSVRIQIEKLNEICADLSVQFLSSTSPFHADRTGKPHVRIALNNEYEQSVLIPDAAFMLRRQTDSKCLLFFLEIDMGTESLVASKSASADLQKKILSYRFVLGRKLYRRFAETFDAHFSGFRTLVVAHTPERKEKICRIVRERAPTDFIWVSDLQQISSASVYASIWHRGGQLSGVESILGSMAPKDFESPSCRTARKPPDLRKDESKCRK